MYHRIEDLGEPVGVRAGAHVLKGILSVPPEAEAAVIFAHGTGRSRFDPADHKVARHLHNAGFATLLLEFLDEGELKDPSNASDTELMAMRLEQAADWLEGLGQTMGLRLGLYGCGTGAAGALIAASRLPLERVGALVCQSGRLDRASFYFRELRIPTLLLVGEDDPQGMSIAEKDLPRLACPKDMQVIFGGGPMLLEESSLEQAALAAARWFRLNLAPLKAH